MQTESVRGEVRKPGGRKAAQRLRRAGMIPAVIYGHNEPPESIAISAHDLGQVLAHHQQIITVDTGGKQNSYLIKEVQYDHLQKDPQHIDLMRVDLSEKVTVTVAIELRGEAKGVLQEDGVLNTNLFEVEVACPVSAIPESIIGHVNDLGLGDSLLVSQLEFPANVVPIDPELPVASVQAKREALEPVAGEEAETAGEEGAEPEVISRGKEDEEQGERS